MWENENVKINIEDIRLVAYWIKDWDRRWEEMITELIKWTFDKSKYLR